MLWLLVPMTLLVLYNLPKIFQIWVAHRVFKSKLSWMGPASHIEDYGGAGSSGRVTWEKRRRRIVYERLYQGSEELRFELTSPFYYAIVQFQKDSNGWQKGMTFRLGPHRCCIRYAYRGREMVSDFSEEPSILGEALILGRQTLITLQGS